MSARFLAVPGALLLGGAAGWLAQWLHVPLPWMVGPMAAMAAARFRRAPLALPPGGRQAGQLVIGVALGLYFTPAVGQEVLATGAWMVLLGALAIGIGYVCAWVLSRLSGIDLGTAFFASVPGGASEMAVLAERHGASIPHVAVAHSLRILLVVVIVPGALTLLGVTGTDVYAPPQPGASAAGLLTLLALALGAALVALQFRVPNAWILGPLAVTILLTLNQVDLSAMPAWLSALGQLLIGLALGSRFEPEFMRSAPRYTGALLASIAVALVLAAGVGFALAWASGLNPASMVLAAAPGGIAEMCITAKVLQLGVPLVTAFHVTRFVMVVTLTGPLVRLSLRAA
ncbi:MAG: AbrB family transcriptional regulator [Pseudomonadota bacterium]